MAPSEREVVVARISLKRMTLTCHIGRDAPRLARRLPGWDGKRSLIDGLPEKATSKEIEELILSEMEKGRRAWLQLTIEVDDIPLAFWLPEELDMVCETFQMRPFPTARTLALRSPGESRLNSHWLSRLPKAAKAPKYRAHFLRVVEASPPELRKFREFYK
ncbi:MAG: hypothetical protein ACP5RC_07350 [Halothiobacillaceae bacterium]